MSSGPAVCIPILEVPTVVGVAATPRGASCSRNTNKIKIGGGKDLHRLRARVVDAEVDVPGLLQEGFMPEAVIALVGECLVFSPLTLRFVHAPTQRAFDAEAALGQSNASVIFIFVEIFIQAGFINLFTESGHTTLRNLMFVSLFASIAAFMADIVRIAMTVRARRLLSPRRVSATACGNDHDASAAPAPAIPSPKGSSARRSLSLSHQRVSIASPRGGVSLRRAAKCEPGSKQARANLQEGALLLALQQQNDAAVEEPKRWLRRAAMVAEIVGAVMLLAPLMGFVLQFLASPEAFCSQEVVQRVEIASVNQTTFYCRRVMRGFATIPMYSMIARIPRFPATVGISAVIILVAALRSFSVLSFASVPVVLRAFQFVLALMVVLLHVAFRWAVDVAAVRSFADRRRAAAHVERLRYEHEALEAYAAELVPQLQRRRRSTGPTPREEWSCNAPLPEGGTASVASSNSSLGDLLATRDFAAQAVVLAVGLLDYARFCRDTMPHPCAVATAALLSQVHEAVCPEGAGDDRPDVTERSGDTYIAVFGLVGAGRQRGAQASALAAARCLAAVADLGGRSESQRDTTGAPLYPELCMSLHVGPALGDFPGTSASTQRYCVCGGGVDGALAMLAACQAPDDTILISGAAVAVLGGAVVDAGTPDTVRAVTVGGGAFGVRPTETIAAHGCVALELDFVPPHDSPVTPSLTILDVTARAQTSPQSALAKSSGPELPAAPPASGVTVGEVAAGPTENHPTHSSELVSAHASTTSGGTSLTTLLPGMGASLSRNGLSVLGGSAARDAGAARVLSHCVAGAERLRAAVMGEQQRRLRLLRAPLCGLVSGGAEDSAEGVGGCCGGLFAGLRPLCFADAAVEHRYREGYLRREHRRLPHLAMDALFIFAGVYVLADFFVGSLFWDRPLAATFGEADELILFSPKHTAALTSMIVWEVLAVAAVAVRYRSTATTPEPCAEERGMIRKWAEDTLLSHTTRFTIFAPILMLFQPSVFSMNPGYGAVLFIGALYLEPLPSGFAVPRLALRLLVPGMVIVIMGFLQPLLSVEIFLFFVMFLWPLVALFGRLAMDRRDRAAFVAVEATAAYCDALGQQEALRGEVLEGAAPAQMRLLLTDMTTAAMASSSEEDAVPAKAASDDTELAAEKGPLAQPCRDYGLVRVGAAGRPAAVLQLDHVVLVRVRFDALLTTGDAEVPVAALAAVGLGPADGAAAFLCVGRAEQFAAFMAVVDAAVQAHAPLSVIEARRDEVLVGGPWGDMIAHVAGFEGSGVPAERFAASALGFLRDLQVRMNSVPGYGRAFSFSAVATAEDAFVLMRCTLYPSFDVLGPGAGRVRELLRAAPPGTVAVTDAFRRCLPVAGPVLAQPDAADALSTLRVALWATRHGQRARLTGLPVESVAEQNAK